MNILKGKRRPDGTSPHLLVPGEYVVYESQWFGCTPNGDLANFSKHNVVENPDNGTITVSPSILCKGNISWHGFIVDGVWIDA